MKTSIFILFVIILAPFKSLTASVAWDEQTLIPLTKLEQLVEPIKPFKLSNPNAFFQHREKMVKRFNPAREEDWDSCVQRFSEINDWPKENTETLKIEIWNCNHILFSLPDVNKKYLGDLENLFVIWSTTSPNIWTISNSEKPTQPQWYQSVSNVSNLALWYSFYEEKLQISETQKRDIENYLKSYLLGVDFTKGMYQNRKRCPEEAQLISEKSTGTNFCGSVRFKVATGKLALGFKLEDKKLIESGIKDLKISLLAHDNQGYFVPYSPAKKQGYAFSYYYRQAKFLSVLAEIIAMRGYNFLEFKMPHGATISESIKFTRQVSVDNHQLLGKYPGDGSIYAGDPWSNWNRLKTLSHSDFIRENMGNDGLFDPANRASQFALNNPRFAFVYFPVDFVRARNYRQRDTDDFSPVYPMSIVLGNSLKSHSELVEDAVNIVPNKKTQKQLLAEIDQAKRIAEQLEEASKKATERQINSENALNIGIQRHGLKADDNGRWRLETPFQGSISRWKITEIVEPKKAGKSAKYRFRIELLDEQKSTTFDYKITLYTNHEDFKVGLSIKNLVMRGEVPYEKWKSIMKSCNALEDDEYFMEIPIQSTDSDLQSKFECILSKNENEQIIDLIQSMIFAGQFMMNNYK